VAELGGSVASHLNSGAGGKDDIAKTALHLRVNVVHHLAAGDPQEAARKHREPRGILGNGRPSLGCRQSFDGGKESLAGIVNRLGKAHYALVAGFGPRASAESVTFRSYTSLHRQQ
jgi:hypothetical protein